MRSWTLLLTLALVPAFGCDGCDRDPNMDGGTDGGVDGSPDGMTDTDVPDRFVPDGGPDVWPGCEDLSGRPGPAVMECGNGTAPVPGACSIEAGDSNLLITGDVLQPGSVKRRGQVLIVNGSIACADCDCRAAAGASTATKIDCDGVISPGLINTHDHVTFAGDPNPGTTERFEHRHHWRRGTDGHTDIRGGSMATREEKKWGEIRMVISGATATNGSGNTDGLLRNLDRGDTEGIGRAVVEYDTFPLGDTGGEQFSMGCSSYDDLPNPLDVQMEVVYAPHIAEGINQAARNEFLCLSQGAGDVVGPNMSMIHGIALLPSDIAEVAGDEASLIWSPRSNIALYGDTARAQIYAALGVNIALGTDWLNSGSMNMLREIQCADEFNTAHLNGFFSDEELWLMATRNAAFAMGVSDALGELAVGKVGDIAIYAKNGRADHRAVIEGLPEQVLLVLRGGRPMYGQGDVVNGIAANTGQDCEQWDVCGTNKALCVRGDFDEGGLAEVLADVQLEGTYPAFFCGADPQDEPSCFPERNNTNQAYPSPVVNGSTQYSGMASATDADGDGIDDGVDNCPCTFNPIRPMDNGVQPDFDSDGYGDACDPCPLAMGVSDCPAPMTGDRDGDMVQNESDNCTDTPNPDQADRDMDGKGDACDACPDAPNPGIAACPATIYDVKTGAIEVGGNVSMSGVVVTAVGETGFVVQVPPTSPDFAGVDNSGIFCFEGSAPTVSVGDLVDFTAAQVNNFFGQLQLTRPTYTSSGTTAVPAPTLVTPAEVATGMPRATTLEGTLIAVENVTVSNASPMGGAGDDATNEFELDGGLRVDDFFYEISPQPMNGATYPSLTGVLMARNSLSKLIVRSMDDVAAGPPQVARVEPALSYVRAGGAAAPTFPEPLTVVLTRNVSEATEVTVTAGAGLTVMNVTIPAGSNSAPIMVSAAAMTGEVAVTAELNGGSAMANVRALGAAESGSVTSISPNPGAVGLSSALPMTVEIDLPAAPPGLMVNLMASGAGTVPASVMIPANETTAEFNFMAGATAGMATITATGGGGSAMAVVDVREASGDGVVINEVDYDQPGADGPEFVELYNVGGSAVDLTGFTLFLVNGNSTATDYGDIALSGTLAPGEFLVVGADGVTVPAGVTKIELTTSIQNGPDGIALVDGTGMLVDALSYEGALTAVTVGGMGPISLVEGTVTAEQDRGAGSLVRTPDGNDTDNAAADWSESDAPTPGAPN